MAGITYKDAGVNYEPMDLFKVMCQREAAETAVQLKQHGMRELDWSRGESAYLTRLPDGTVMGFVIEGLGTKNLVADAMPRKPDGGSHYAGPARCTVAMVVNDLLAYGIMPATVAMHIAAGDSAWFSDTRRCHDLIRGWRFACEEAGAAWGGGETPTLKGIVDPNTVLLSGSAVGFAKEEEIYTGVIRDGDLILIVRSSGVHANGLTFARKIAEDLPNGYLTPLPSGTPYGESLLVPTVIYRRATDKLRRAGIKVRYAVNITGHGALKFMRHPDPFTYLVDNLWAPHEIFDFIQKHAEVDDREMYRTFNMGVGFAFYVAQEDEKRVRELCDGHTMMVAGRIVASKERRVVLRQPKLEFSGDELQLR